MEDIEKIFETLKTSVIDLAKSTFSDYVLEAEKDMVTFLNKSKNDIKKY
jgi:hypothetical protein